MNDVVVDTSVWSLALRRSRGVAVPTTAELANLIRDGRALMLGVIRQELLSGVRTPQQFESLRLHLRAFPDVEIGTADYEEAARLCNRCRSRGIQGSTTDFFICAVAVRRRLSVFTTDDDFTHYFTHYAKAIRLKLHQGTG